MVTDMSQWMPRSAEEEKRRHERGYCSVLSSVYDNSTDRPRHIGPAVVVDISESGLAMSCDFEVPVGASLLVRNAYFRAHVIVRNTQKTDSGARIGSEFTRPVEWTGSLMQLQAVPPAAASPTLPPKTSVPPPVITDHLPSLQSAERKYSVYLQFLQGIEQARSRLSSVIIEAVRNVEAALFRTNNDRAANRGTGEVTSRGSELCILLCGSRPDSASALSTSPERLLKPCRSCVADQARES